MHSMRVKLVALLALFVSCTMIVCVILNSIFLEGYYTTSKKIVLNNVYEQLKKIDDPNLFFANSENCTTFYKICESGNVSLTIVDAAGDEMFYTGTNMKNRITERMISGDIDMENGSYKANMVTDKKSGLKYLEMYGGINSDTYFFARVAIEGIQQSVSISNRFFLYISFLATMCSSVFMWTVSKHFTAPILKLVNISDKMCKLNFEAKYYPNGSGDEVDVLGTSMNNLSSKLESTIQDLKKANMELQTDIDKKVEIDNMRKDFISNVSHELKTPISLIQGYAEGLKESINDDAESREFYCDVIMDEADRMNKMVRNLLSLNQLEYGNTPLEINRFDIISVINGVLINVKLLIEQKDIKVIFDNYESMYVWADEFQIEQVVTNYINNAINHCDGEKIIRIDVEKIGDDVNVSVFNTGKNIPESELDKIWIKFYKVDKARTREYGGNGIGLSIVKAIMNLHKKKFGVKNVKNGVVFYFALDGRDDILLNNVKDNN